MKKAKTKTKSKPKKPGLISKIKKTVKDKLVRRQELQYVKAMTEMLNSRSGNGSGGALVTDKNGQTRFVEFKSKQEALDILEQVRKGELSLAIR